MKPEKLSDIKKELRALNSDQLIELCLKLAKFKKDNKELLSYFLYNSDAPLAYAESVKDGLIHEFQTLKKYDYHSAKELRKILRLLGKHAKYTGSAEVEIELILWFCFNYLMYADTRSHYKPLHTIFTRQIEKLRKLIPKLHEDLQFDYSTEYEKLLEDADQKLRWFKKDAFRL